MKERLMLVLRWYAIGSVFSILILGGMLFRLRLLGRYDLDEQLWVTGVGGVVYASILMIAGGPLAIAAQFGWIMIAERFPGIERNWILRISGLVLLGLLVGQVVLFMWIAASGFYGSLRAIFARMADDEWSVIWVSVGFVACSVMPRLFSSRLRQPLVGRLNA